jgi:hydrogenase maturation protease
MREFVHPDRLLEAGRGTAAETGNSARGKSDESRPAAEPGRRWEVGLRKLLGDTRTPLHIVGVGNPMRGDDAVGLEIVSQLMKRIEKTRLSNVILHLPVSMPERVFSQIDCGKERLLIFDAVESGGMPGEVVLASLGDSKFGYFATHNVPLRVMPEVAANPSNVYVSGIEPAVLEVGDGLSDAVRSSADYVVSVVESALGGGTDGLP